MFGSSRKNRGPVQPLTRETANPNAATAAASAFMRKEPAPTSLSSAAAAAALKARPTTPTNVSEAQSKRTRRSESVSSTGTRGRRQARSTELYRSPSTGSMTERTFRSPSPSPGRAPAPRRTEVPPVPSLPRNTPRPASSHSGSGMTINTQNFRTASQKQQDGQGSWFGGATIGNTANMRKSDQILQQHVYHSREDSDARPGSVSPSINFSYPRAQTESPSPEGEPAMVYDANSRRMVPKVDLMMRGQSVRSAADAPVKKRDSKVSRSGSHLSKGSLGRIKGTALETPLPASRDSTPPARRQTPVQITKELSPAPQPRRAPEPQLSREQTLVEPESDYEEEVKPTQSNVGANISTNEEMAAPPLNKKPSIVREESEPEEDDGAERGHEHSAIDAIPTRSSHAGTATVDHQPTSQKPEPVKFLAPEETLEAPSQELVQPSPSVRRARVHSESPARSPARSAHFAPTTDQLLVRHEPPPRSLSPRKSALKNASSARGASPSDDSSEASGPVSSFNPKDEQARKKSARVSFNDDSNVVVGEAAEPIETDSPMVPSPQTKKTWRNAFGVIKKDKEVDEDETMSPRPALPLFGSVREKKPKEQIDSERPLVRPSERAWSPPPVSSPLRQSAAPEAEGPSSDSAIGSILSSEASAKNEANISRTREPLPPVVTSAEGMAYDSSSFMSTDDETQYPDAPETIETAEDGPSVTVVEPVQKIPEKAEEFVKTTDTRPDEPEVFETLKPEGKLNGSAVAENASSASTAGRITQLPSIAITNPSPAAVEESKISPDAEYFDVPGGFPDDDETPTAPPPAPVVSAPVVQEVSASAPPIETEPAPSSPTRSTLIMSDIQEEEEVTDHSSIYSDAYEDMSDAEAGGFMSLDAVLTAPADSKVSKLYQKTKRKSQEHTRQPALATTEEALQKEDDEEPTQNDWDKAKVYWKSLSIDQRRQLEMEALEEAGEEADGEGDGKVKKTKKKRKSTDRPISTSSISSQARHPDRVYQIQPGTSWASDDEQTVERPTSTPSPQQTSPVAAPKFRKSMRGSPPPKEEPAPAQPAMRKSMRANGGPSKPQQPAASSRPVSYHPTTAVESSKDTRRALSQDSRPMSSSGPAGGMKSTMRRRGSDSSESSFKRVRPQSQGFAFRSTMRASAVPEPEPPRPSTATKGSGRFSLRSLSPTGSNTFRRGSFSTPPAQQTTTMGGPSRMRTSLRAQPPKPTKQKSSFFGGKKEKKSRFGDSSDEEDGGGRFFNSRFAESSDEEDAAPAPKAGGMASKSMRPNKGANTAAAAALGRPPVRSDSPDLPDSDDDIVQPKRNTIVGATNGRPTGQLQRNRSGRGSYTGPASPGVLGTEGVGERPAHERRGSFMSNILRRKKDNTGKITRDTGESAARRDTHLQRSQEELNVIRSSSGRVLHKREPSWPLPDAQPTNGESSTPQRPATSSGPPSTAKTGFLKRRSTSHQGIPPQLQQTQVPQPDSPATPSSIPDGTVGAAGKKKKFGTLRKMFRLND